MRDNSYNATLIKETIQSPSEENNFNFPIFCTRKGERTTYSNILWNISVVSIRLLIYAFLLIFLIVRAASGSKTPSVSRHILLNMRYVAAYMLAVMGGIENPSADDLKMIIGSVGIESDNDKIDLVISKLKGKNIEELVVKSQDLLASVCGGSGSTCIQTGTPQVKVVSREDEEKPTVDDGDDSDGSDVSFGLLFD
ncbi:RP-LP2 [Mytilus coruscus]|uniref:Large ribosomal subunit protein P2 n=1 Tax=Mytilus coruscus TaxID=42192 RepID=A0A6J8AA36_MYTCO|nr:RP-LP2 [Mytilus coruscus]